MKHLLAFATGLICASSWFSSCKDTQTYAELVADEKEYISTWIKDNPFNIQFDHIISKDEEWVNNVAEKILEDSIHPCNFIELGQWYRITEGNFKRLYFRINSWGNDSLSQASTPDVDLTEEQQIAAMRNGAKFYEGRNVLVRYDSLYLISNFDYDPANLDDNIKGDNLDPLAFILCYNWNRNYYSSNYYSMYYSTGSSYECTSGGIGFPIRFLWEGGNASIICPFSLIEQSMSSSYYTLYYGDITYKKSNYLPQ